MYRVCAYRVVNMQLLVDELDGEYQNDTAYRTYYNSTCRRNHIASGSDADKSGENTVQRERNDGLPYLIQQVNMVAKPPTAAARLVVRNRERLPRGLLRQRLQVVNLG